MTPLYDDLNPPPTPNFPFVDLKEEPRDLQLFLSVKKHDGGSSDQQASSSSSSSSSLQSTGDHRTIDGRNSSFGDYGSAGDHNGISVRWMSSNMRLMKKMMNSNCSNGSTDHRKAIKFTDKLRRRVDDNGETDYSLGKANNNAVRVCSDCNTTTTPLWRSGPRGPKSLCNACGIRQRKARRAMEAAAAETAAGVATGAAISLKIKVQNNKEKKSRIGQFRKQLFKSPSDHNSHCNHQQIQKKLCFEEFALSLSKNSALQRVFPQDVEDAAILLMELSCGLIHG
ncbi:GATA transcription factor 23 [Hibiscus syriacus]|uniref:GATA transcription factor 23 n=1 Tax=Hibiscus syriacus TaxID=106335 RepID=A0A6A2ZAT8_HIBSY|nr:GATA transcription factor 23 [Hibiscus syriacus]